MNQRNYEVMFIVRPDVAEEDMDKLISGLEGTVAHGGGAVTSVEKLGRRRLAYQVRKFNDGNYVLMHVDAGGGLVAELERRLRVSEPVIKFITVRMDEEDKRLAKVKALRDSRKKMSAQPVAPPPAAEPEAASAPEAETGSDSGQASDAATAGAAAS